MKNRVRFGFGWLKGGRGLWGWWRLKVAGVVGVCGVVEVEGHREGTRHVGPMYAVVFLVLKEKMNQVQLTCLFSVLNNGAAMKK